MLPVRRQGEIKRFMSTLSWNHVDILTNWLTGARPWLPDFDEKSFFIELKFISRLKNLKLVILSRLR